MYFQINLMKMLGKVLVLLLQLQLLYYPSEGNLESQDWKVVENWPMYNAFGQISSVSLDSAGNIYVFHRGDRIWDSTTFLDNHTLRNPDIGPIPKETIIVLEALDGSVQKKTGANKFFMPHGLTVDYMDNIWITDVALHQVFKFSPLNKSSSGLAHPEIELGHRFEPGNDNEHFCKPTDVVVDRLTGDFYVSDGYCNPRIIKYNKYGKCILSWGRSSYTGPLNGYTFNVPHAFSISPDDTLFLADRENSRALSFSAQTGVFKRSFKENSKVYSVAYSSASGYPENEIALKMRKHLFILSNSYPSYAGIVTVFNVENGEVVKTFGPPNGFSNPHDLALSADGKFCYVVELSPYKIWKFGLGLSEDKVNEGEGGENFQSEKKVDNELIGVGTLLAIGVVSFVVFVIFLIFIFHIHKRKSGNAQYEMRRLILDDEEEIGVNIS